MADSNDDDRLRRLEERIARARKAQMPPPPRAESKAFSQANMAWQMIIELVSGLLIGLGIGFGLDWLFGTRPLFLVVFVLLGFGAGVNVMLRTAREMQKKAAAEASAGKDGNEGR